MSMLWLAKQISPENLERVKRDPSLVQKILDNAVETAARDDDGLAASQGEGTSGSGVLDLDKAWDGVHWLLALDKGPTDAPESKIIFGGTEVGEDTGYGPARYLTAEEVRRAAEALGQVSRDELARRFDPAKMDDASVYPNFWQEYPQDGLHWLLESIDRLVPYMRDAAARRNAILTFVY